MRSRRVLATPTATLLLVSSITSEQVRVETTGKHHTFEPGFFAKTSRAIFQTFTSDGIKKRAAKKLQAGLEKVERMEKEQQWLRKHGSPQRVLDLPEHASYAEIKTRYQDLILDTHPDTASHKQSYVEQVRGIVIKNQSVAEKRGTLNAVMPIAVPEPATFEEVRQAHAILVDPNSLYHVNGTNNELLTEVRYFTGKEDNALSTPTTKLAIASWIMFAIVAGIFLSVVVKQIYERTLELIDPDFYHKLMSKEKDERTRREAGEIVNTDPERAKPDAVLKVLRPGLFLHGTPS
jgi:hypothetical protein